MRSPFDGQPLDRDDARHLADTLNAVADPARLQIISLLQSAPGGELTVSDLPGPLGLSQPTVSHHLQILTEAGLVERDRRGVWAYYRLAPRTLSALAGAIRPKGRAR